MLGTTTKNAFYKIAYGMRNDTAVTAAPTCSTGNCTWPAFSSLAMCSSCTDLSDKVYHNSNPSASEWWLPNNAWMDDGALFKTHSFLPTIRYNTTIKQAFVDLTYLHHAIWPNGTKNQPHASECILYFCVKQYTVRVDAGVYLENVLSSWPGPHEPIPGAPDLSAYAGNTPKSPFEVDLILRPPGQDDEYHVDARAFYQLKAWLGDVVADTGYAGLSYGNEADGSDVAQAMYEIQTGGDIDQGDAANGPDRVMKTIADGLSAAMRRQGNGSAVVMGQALREESFVRARWGWAILPIALVLLTCGFMATTLVLAARRGVPTWKSSALATLAHGLNEELSARVTASRLDVMEAKARGHRMGMPARGQQWRLEPAGA